MATGGLLWIIFAAVGWLSREFAWHEPAAERPILAVIALFSAAFGCYFIAMGIVAKGLPERQLPTIIVFSVAFRALLLFSEPILEVDAYRYLWDGRVTVSGVSPFRYSPRQILTADRSTQLPEDLRELAELRDSSEPLRSVLGRIHFADLTTVYPPVSQGVFALAAFSTPDSASVSTRLVVLKAWIIAFDIGTLLLLIRILRLTSLPESWAAAWGWCPLVLKEFANSGHLDSIAVCLTTLSVLLALRGLWPETEVSTRAGTRLAVSAAVVLALATGAKIYPIVLAPWLLLRCRRQLGIMQTAVIAGSLAFVVALVLGPMLLTAPVRVDSQPASVAARVTDGPPVPPIPDESFDREPPAEPAGSGMAAFATRWRMNDFLFLLLAENLQPLRPDQPRAWFAIIPAAWRTALVEQITHRTSLTPESVPFLLARGITLAVFLCLACRFAQVGSVSDQSVLWLRQAFLTLAWFWLLLPTQNPWYWTWALPLLPFARASAWWAVSALVMLYYLRFWFGIHGGQNILGTPYGSVEFFDYVVTWLEYAPWFVWLAAEAWLNRRQN